MDCQSLNRAWNRARGGRSTPPLPRWIEFKGHKLVQVREDVDAWKQLHDSPAAMAIAARILREQEDEPWKRAWNHVGELEQQKRDLQKLDVKWCQQHPIRAFLRQCWYDFKTR